MPASSHRDVSGLSCPVEPIKDRLRVPQPNGPDSYCPSRELVSGDMIGDIERAKIVITNYHAFKPRKRLELSKGGRPLLLGREAEELNTLEAEELSDHVESRRWRDGEIAARIAAETRTS